jgi:hypothetical protein
MHLLGGVIEDAAEFTHRTGRLLVIGQVRQRHVAVRARLLMNCATSPLAGDRGVEPDLGLVEPESR